MQDTSGVIDYVRIEHAGQPVGGPPVPGLALLGVGSGTGIEHLQVHGAQGEGVFVSGGNVNLRYLVLTGNMLADWPGMMAGGEWLWGLGQFIQVQIPSGGMSGLRGSNLQAAPDAGPRSQPDLYHVTVVGSGPMGATGTALLLQNGTAEVFRDMILINAGQGVDLNGAAVCAQVAGDSLQFSHSIVFANLTNFSVDADCIDESAFVLDPARFNRVVDPRPARTGQHPDAGTPVPCSVRLRPRAAWLRPPTCFSTLRRPGWVRCHRPASPGLIFPGMPGGAAAGRAECPDKPAGGR